MGGRGIFFLQRPTSFSRAGGHYSKSSAACVCRRPLAVVVERKGESFRVTRVRVVEVASELDGAIGRRTLKRPRRERASARSWARAPRRMLANDSPAAAANDRDRGEAKLDTYSLVEIGVRTTHRSSSPTRSSPSRPCPSRPCPPRRRAPSARSPAASGPRGRPAPAPSVPSGICSAARRTGALHR